MTPLPSTPLPASLFTGEYPIDIKERWKEINIKLICYTPFKEEAIT